VSTAATDIELDTGWMANAACRGLDVNLFFPDRGDIEGAHTAKRVCVGCPVRHECLEWAMTQPGYKEAGILGGHTAKERSRIRKLRRARVTRQRNATAECGTDSGYYRHHRFAEPACDACTAAHAHKERLRYHLITT
jgi:WhiB family transcriptional regulator, redox-sensing transcriptional regulator